ncbi:MAG: hypothetical protein LBP19_01905 [Treponema sp.]|jgi:hypothetical protein|nr:hypothetical protein [Treponema sp.]
MRESYAPHTSYSYSSSIPARYYRRVYAHRKNLIFVSVVYEIRRIGFLVGFRQSGMDTAFQKK